MRSPKPEARNPKEGRKPKLQEATCWSWKGAPSGPEPGRTTAYRAVVWSHRHVRFLACAERQLISEETEVVWQIAIESGNRKGAYYEEPK